MSRLFGYAGAILRVDLTSGRMKRLGLSRSMALSFLGGRGFNSKRLFDEVPAGIDPLSPMNKLMFATGPLAGTMFPLGSRFNVSGKSPQTGLLGDSNAGGHFGAEMKFAGFDQIVIEGRSKTPVYLYVDNGKAELRKADSLWGLTVYEADKAVRQEVGDPSVQVAVIGPAAENGVKFAGIFVNRIRAAARTGMGTLMASKNLKAIVVRGDGFVEVADPGMFEKLVDRLEEELYSHEQYWPRRLMGTSRILMAANRLGILPTRHFTSGIFEHAYEVSGERLAREFNFKNRACFSCALPCSRVFIVREGKFAGLFGEGPEYEPLGCFTARIGNGDLGLALKAVDMVNSLGMDAISTGECISWAMELYNRGLLTIEETGLDLTWGNGEAVLKLIEMIAYRQGFGDVLADGVKAAAEKIRRGRDLAFHVKGLEMIMADPRGLKGYALGFAVSSRGGDHLRSEPFVELSDDPERGRELFGIPEATMRMRYRGKGALVAYFENWCAVVDSLEVCKNLAENMEILTFERTADVLKAVVGVDLKPVEVARIGERIVNVERAFLVREGVRRRDDSLPRRFLKEPLHDGRSKGSVVELDEMLDEYYTIRGWDLKTGIPKREKLVELGLEKIVEDLERSGVIPP